MADNPSLLTEELIDDVINSTPALSIHSIEAVQGLWSGFGQIERVALSGDIPSTAVIKIIRIPEQTSHPRGWGSAESDQRKISSYAIEANWYRDYAIQCSPQSKVPDYLGDGQTKSGTRWILIEDLTKPYPRRMSQLSLQQVLVCIRWLGVFHRQYLNVSAENLWPVGTYWHLATRQKEFAAMQNKPLQSSAEKLDELLNTAQYQTLVHGDAKVANFCFSDDLKSVAAVDFQYVGAGVGVKDLAYLLGSCLAENDIALNEEHLLDVYFDALNAGPDVEAEWRSLYVIAWTDFYRFLDGWMPGHPKANRYTKSLAERAYETIKQFN